MDDIHIASSNCNSVVALSALRPRLELTADGGWYCTRDNRWLCGDPLHALAEFDVLEWIER